MPDLARVFPRQTSMTPMDEHVYIGEPTLFTPHYDEVFISVTFTWDKPEAERLYDLWLEYGFTVHLGGPAYDDPGDEFEPGRFLRKGVTITSRGCPHNCSYCYVPNREGKIRELEIKPGHIIQDNNLLACSKEHIRKVFNMLKGQRGIQFTGGMEAARLQSWMIEELRGLRIKQMFFAYDNYFAKQRVAIVASLLRPHFQRRHLRCYVLIGHEADTIDEAINRLRYVWDIGMFPFAMLYCGDDGKYTQGPEWCALQKTFARPAATKAYFRAKP